MSLELALSKPPASENVLDRTLITAAFVFLSAAAIILAIVPPSVGYEISIYDQYPLSFWFFICASVSCGISSLVYIAFRRADKSGWWSFAALAVICSNVLILLLPVARGYFLTDRADTAQFFAQVRYIAITGHLGSGNMYPILHTLTYALSTLGGLDFDSAKALLLVVFYLLFVGGLYLIAKELETNTTRSILMIAFGSVLLFGYFNSFLIPTQLFIFLLPVFFFFVFRRYKFPADHTNVVVLFVFALTLPFVHPFGCLMLVILLLEFEVARRLHGSLSNQSTSSSVGDFILPKLARDYVPSSSREGSRSTARAFGRRMLTVGPTVVPAMVLFVAFFVWYSFFWRFVMSVRQAYDWFFLGSGTPSVEASTIEWNKSGLGFVDFLRVLFLTYGQTIIYLALAMIAFCIILRKMRSRRAMPSVVELFLPLLIASSVFLFAASQVADFISGIGNGVRILNFGLFGAVVLNGIVFSNWIPSLSRKKVKVFAISLILVLIVTSAIIGIFNTYDSPITLHASEEVSRTEMQSAAFLLAHEGNNTTLQFDDWTSNARLVIYGWDGVYVYPQQFQTPPSHLGYANATSLSAAINATSYIVVNQRIVDFKTKMWPTQGYFTLDDLNRLAADQSVEKVYSNGGVYIGFVPVQGQ